MSNDSFRVLVVDDDADILKAARLVLTRAGHEVAEARDVEAAWAVLAAVEVDVVLLDLNFVRGRTDGSEGFGMLAGILAMDRSASIIVVTGHGGVAVAVQAMRGGAADFVVKPWNNDRLLASVTRAGILRRARNATEDVASTMTADRILLGQAAEVARARTVIHRVASTDAALLVRGPTGSGKSLVADLTHRASRRSEREMIAVDCRASSIDDHFGDRLGQGLQQASGGTLLLDAVDELPSHQQASIFRSGLDVRVIATSRLDRRGLRDRVGEDLFARLSTIEIDMPPLASRGDDALLLARHFLARFAMHHGRTDMGLSPEAVAAIAGDAWPDNVRGLRRSMERAVLLGGDGPVDVADLASSLVPDDPSPRAIAADLNLSRSERMLIVAALERHAFNVSRAAVELGLTRAALYRRMEKHGL